MRSYVILTGTLFALLLVAHIWRMVQEGTGLASDPFFLVMTLLSAVLSFWAFRLVRQAPR